MQIRDDWSLILANYNGTYLFTTWPSGPQSMPDRDVRFVPTADSCTATNYYACWELFRESS